MSTYDKKSLIHYGVLGMKWGHRKPKIGSLTDSFTIKKGSNIYRTTSNKDEGLSGHAFTTVDKKDALGYMYRGSMFNNTSFNMEFKVTKDIVTPSKKTRVDTFIKLLDNDPEFRKALSSSIATYKVYSSPEAIEKKLSKLKTAEAKSREYNQSLALGVAGNKKVRDKYFESLAKQGYNAMVDDADATIVSRMPLIIFDKQNTLEVISVNKINRKYIKDFKKE